MALNVEIKARCKNPDGIKEKLLSMGAEYKGCDHQIDTYFKVPNGRLKLREGNIERNLIQYRRSDQAEPKSSHFRLFPVSENSSLKNILLDSLGILAIVEKNRDIYFIKNVKFHVDSVKGLGSFVEIEASDLYDPLTKTQLLDQCEYYIKELDILENDLVLNSYSDMILAQV